MIVEGVLHLGETLSEARVATWLNVSRTPVREAFARLQIEGLIISEPQRRTCVFTPSTKDLDDICDVRCCLEARALKLAVERHRDKLGTRLAEINDLMRAAINKEDVQEYLRLDIDFHQAIFDCTDNQFLNDAYQTIASKLAAFRTRLASHQNYLRKGVVEHQRLGAFVAAGDLEAALAVMEEHISRSSDSFWKLNSESLQTGVRRAHPEYSESNGLGMAPVSSKLNRRKNTSDALIERQDSRKSGDDDKKVDDKCVDETPVEEKDVDGNRRGRPRIYVDDAARKREWAARRRDREAMERLARGMPAPKRGRPRKATSLHHGPEGPSAGPRK